MLGSVKAVVALHPEVWTTSLIQKGDQSDDHYMYAINWVICFSFKRLTNIGERAKTTEGFPARLLALVET